MRTVPARVVDPAEMAGDERDDLKRVVGEIEESGTIELDALPAAVRALLLFTLDACAKGQIVATVAGGKPLTPTEAAGLLGMFGPISFACATRDASRATRSAMPCASRPTRSCES